MKNMETKIVVKIRFLKNGGYGRLSLLLSWPSLQMGMEEEIKVPICMIKQK